MPHGVASACRDAAVPCIALAGAIEDSAAILSANLLTAAFCICDRPMSLDESLTDARHLLSASAANVLRSLQSCHQ